MDHAASEPDRRTDPQLRDLLEELSRREPIFHRELQTTREDFERLTDPGFWETGASGRRYSREHVWSVLEQRYAARADRRPAAARHPSPPPEDDWRTSEFQLRAIAPDTYLLTYTLEQGTRTTRRATIWQRQDGDWKILYHQGTPVADGAP